MLSRVAPRVHAYRALQIPSLSFFLSLNLPSFPPLSSLFWAQQPYLAHAHAGTRQEQRGQPELCGHWGEHCRQRPPQDAEAKDLLAAVGVGPHTSSNLRGSPAGNTAQSGPQQQCQPERNLSDVI